MSTIKEKSDNILNEKNTKIIPENIKEGVQIFDVVGTIKQNTRSFKTVEEMYADTATKELKDLAVIYSSELQNWDGSSAISQLTFPKTVVLTEPATGSYSGEHDFMDYIGGSVRSDSATFHISVYSSNVNVSISYTSTDGLVYTRTDNNDETIVFSDTAMTFTGTVPAVCAEFMKSGVYNFGGLYQYLPHTLKEYCICTPVKTLSTDESSLEKIKVMIPKLLDNDSGVKFTAIHSMEKYIDNRAPEETQLYKAIDYDVYDLLDPAPNNIHTVQTLSNTGKCRYFYQHGVKKYTVVNNEITSVTELEYITDEKSRKFVYFDIDPNDYVSVFCRENSTWDVLLVYEGTDWNSTGNYARVLADDGTYVPVTARGYLPAFTQLTATKEYVYNAIAYGSDGVNEGLLGKNISNIFRDSNAVVYSNLQDFYNKMEPVILTNENKNTYRWVLSIPVRYDGVCLLDTSQLVDMSNLFNQNREIVYIPTIDASSATNMSDAFGINPKLEYVGDILNTGNVTSMAFIFMSCPKLKKLPMMDTSSNTTFSQAFSDCTALEYVPLYNTSNVTNVYAMFANCPNLTNESLNNILAMCKNATKITSSKTLKYIGLTQEQADRCKTLSNYSAFTSAGWITGY